MTSYAEQVNRQAESTARGAIDRPGHCEHRWAEWTQKYSVVMWDEAIVPRRGDDERGQPSARAIKGSEK